MISDARVGDKGVKVRCKTCGYNIVVRPARSASAKDGGAFGELEKDVVVPPAGSASAKDGGPFGEPEKDQELGAASDQVLNSGSHNIRTSEESRDAPSQVKVGESVAREESSAFDVVIVCALHSPELEKVMSAGGVSWDPLPGHHEDPHVYYRATYTTKKGKPISIVAGAPNQMGLSASAVLATKMILRFRPKLVAMVGIAAGVSSERQGFGSILAADTTFDYGSGKIISEAKKLIFRPDHHPLPINTRLKSLLLHWSNRRNELDNIYRSWQGDKPDTVLKLHVGPIGSGAAVVDAKQPILDVLQHWRKLTGIEMEAYAVHRACLDTIEPAPIFLCLKSICDFAENKSDTWQTYAAYTAAEFCHRFLTHEWENLCGSHPRQVRSS
jgi:nucleoside phosphorylase